MTDPCLTLKEIVFAYGDRPVVNNVSQVIEGGLFYGLLGPNGCGKTTLLDLMSGFRRPDAGTVSFRDRPLRTMKGRALAQCLSLVSQDFYIDFPFTVREVVMMGRYPHIGRFAAPSETDCRRVEEVMAITDVARFGDHPVTELSGGERQRTVFARALAQGTAVLLLDEATSNLDIKHTIRLLDIVRRKVKDDGLTVVSVFHDINLAAVYCDRIILMKDGVVAAAGPTEKMMDAGLLEQVFEVESEIRFEPAYRASQAVFKMNRAG
ncbi:MAG: ABC transporter ATP-binding protein [Syntrophobacteraceae bacterium CG07_land_8_20_14_0_80_61_8]|nr:MAG: ABC transporter ATP-binding protein [Syntrophobacteraceae bacterium CG07_land_8_20_14_0_80_61_8]